MRFVPLLIAATLPISTYAQTPFADTLNIEEVICVGFANQKKSNLTGAVSQVNMDQVLGDRPVIGIGAALQGAIPGLAVSGASAPGQPKSFNIRGTLSINGGSPLILIDNVEGDINSLNPDDIASVTVLKDAASAAIYGARAAGGVILITTRHPERNQQFKLDYSFRTAFEESIANPVQASLDQYIAAYREAGFSSQYWAGNGDIARWQELLGQYRAGTLQGVYDNGIFRDEDGAVYFLKESDVLGNSLERGTLNAHNLSVSGGTDRVRYRISGSHSFEDGPMVSSKDSYSKTTISSLISADITSWFTQEANLSYSVQNRSSITTTFRDPYSVRLISWYPEGYMPKEIIGTAEDLLIDSPRNACLYQPAAKSTTGIPRIALKSIIRLLDNWTLTAEYTYQQKEYSYNSYTGRQTVADAQLAVRTLPAEGQDEFVYNTSRDRYSALNVYSNYSLSTASGHNFAAVLGYNRESDSYSYVNNKVLGQSVITVPSLQGGTGVSTAKNGLTEYAILGVFGRVSYNYLGRYLIEANARYDGSSKFPAASRFGFFPSVSAGWRLSEEAFMDWCRPLVNNLKLRASWGSIGNQNIAPYGYVASMSISENLVWLDKGAAVNIISTPGLIRANYTWETVNTLDFGVDLSMLRDRFTAEFDWYRRTTTGMLSNGVELPSVVGTGAPLQNVADMQTRGWELSLGWRDRIGAFGYRLGLNLYDHLSTITKIKNESLNLSYRYSGQTLGEIWAYVTDGFYSIDDFDAEKARTGVWILNEGVPSIDGFTVKPGDVKFKDLDRNSVINAGSNTLEEPGDRKIIGNTTARYQFGGHFGLSFKGLEFTMLFQGVGKRDCFLPVSAVFPFGVGTKEDMPFAAVYYNQTDYWTAKSYDPESPDYMVAANPDARLPRIYGQLENSGSNMRNSDRYMYSGAYLRIKNLTLSYSLPSALLARTRIAKSLRVWASCENPATFSSLPTGYDPESLTWAYPFYRTVSFGAQLTF